MKQRDDFAKRLERAIPIAAIHDYALAKGTAAAASKFGKSRRQIQRYVTAWPKRHEQLKRGTDPERRHWDQRATLMSWFRTSEFGELGKLSLQEQALRVFPRVHARARELETENRFLKGLLRQLEAERRGLKKELTLRASGLDGYGSPRGR